MTSTRSAHRLLTAILSADHQVIWDPHRLEAFLVDAFPGSPDIREPLLLLARCGTPPRFAHGADDQARIQQETHRLSSVLGLPKEWLAPAVASWARALGGSQPIPRQQQGEVADEALLPIDDDVAQALRERYSEQEVSSPWQTVSHDDFEATLQDLLPAQPGVQERILLLHRCGSLQRLSASRDSVQERFLRESNRLQVQLKFPKQWLEAGINDVLTILSLPRVAEAVADAAIAAPQPFRRHGTAVPTDIFGDYFEQGALEFWVAASVAAAPLPEETVATEQVPELGSVASPVAAVPDELVDQESVPELVEDSHSTAPTSSLLTLVILGTVMMLVVSQSVGVKVLRNHHSAVNSVSWSPVLLRLASASDDRTISIWNHDRGQLELTLNYFPSFYSVSWSPDGRKLASTAWDDNTIFIWNAVTGRREKVLSGHTSRVYSVSWSPDGKKLASASDDWTIRIWDSNSGRVVRILNGHEDSVNSVSWSRDGRLASASDDRTIRIWDVNNGNSWSGDDHRGTVNSVSWSPDGKHLASASDDKSIHILNTTTGKLQQILTGHTGSVWSVIWSPDGQRLASGSWDRTVRIWNAASGKQEQTLKGHTNTVYSVSWSPDGRHLASGSGDKTVRIWKTAR